MASAPENTPSQGSSPPANPSPPLDSGSGLNRPPAPDSSGSFSPPPSPSDSSKSSPPPSDSGKSSPPPSDSGSKSSSPPDSSKPPSPPDSSSPPPSPPESLPQAPPTSPPPSTPESPPPSPPNSSPPSTTTPPSNNSPSEPPPSPSNGSPSPPSQTSESPPPPSTLPSTPNTPPYAAPTTPAAPGSPPAPISSRAPPTAVSHAPPGSSLPASPTGPNLTLGQGSPGSGSNGVVSPDSSISVGTIVGIAAGGTIFLALIIIALVCLQRKKKQPSYTGHGHHHQGSDQYYSTPAEHLVKIPPPPGLMGTPMGGGNYWAAPPPPPPANNSSDYSSSYSGPHHTPMPPPSPGMGQAIGAKSQFTYDELAVATNGFSQANLLGQGGFGFVHKGVLADKRVVAVKSLKSGSGQGEREFQAEVEIISRVHHRHLVSLVGYCIADGQRMLVYEFVPNNTLEFHLHGKGRPVMEWSLRLRIAIGSAKGLAYLHEDCHPRIIHRDIKAANILLDDNFEAMVADFGLAKLTSDNYTHVSTRVMGTFGYLAPEYASSGKLTEKSDVFSFGVMLLELITGRRPVDTTSRTMEDSLVDWARPLLTKALEDGNYSELVDPRLEGNYIPHEMAHMIGCAAASIRHSARRRPRMMQIVRALEGDSSLEDLNELGMKPPQVSASTNTSATTETYDTRAYDADMMKFRKMVMPTQEFASSEYGNTSEYGLNPSPSSSDCSTPEGHK